jgi:hypothetical protein
MLKKLLAALILVGASFSANAIVTTFDWPPYVLVESTDPNNQYYSEYIAYCDQWLSSCVIAPLDASLPAWMNEDILWSFNYAVSHGIALRWGACYGNSDVPPCLG